MASQRIPFKLNSTVWVHRPWSFKREDVDALRPIARQLADYRGDLDLESTLRQASVTLKRRFEPRRTAVEDQLDAFGVSLEDLYELIQPAVFLREV